MNTKTVKTGDRKPETGCPFGISWEEVSPTLASTWLEHYNPLNRPLREQSVAVFARDMENGAWSPNHQGIAFNTEGNLIDGQHRLKAIARSGCAQWMLVIRNVPERVVGVKTDVMDTIDRGSIRSIGDMLKLKHGITANPNAIAAICLQIGRLCVEKASFQANRGTMAQTVEILRLYRDSLAWMAEAMPVQPGFRSAPISAPIVMVHAVDPECAVRFLASLIKGAGLSEGHPALTLRTAIFAGDLGRGSVTERTWSSRVMLHAMWLARMGQTMSRVPGVSVDLTGARSWKDMQAERVAAVAVLFPKLSDVPGYKEGFGRRAARVTPKDAPDVEAQAEPQEAPKPRAAMKAEDWKPTPAAEALLRSVR